MRVGVTGATGLIGAELCRSLLADGHQALALGRDAERIKSRIPGADALQWEAGSTLPPDAFDGVDAVVHLAGEPIAGGRWTASRKKAIADSRIFGTHDVVEAMVGSKTGPKLLVSGSAIGFYGNRGDETLDEGSPAGSGFLASVCRRWESEALKGADRGLRVVLLRTGIVLSPKGGALAKMLPPFKLFAGGPLGSGDQWMSWIHLEDEVRLIRHLLESSKTVGPVNATAPNPVTNLEFSKTLGKVLARPAFMPAPGFALRLLLGEMAEALLLEGQRVLPQAALANGFQFKYPQLEVALRHLLQ